MNVAHMDVLCEAKLIGGASGGRDDEIQSGFNSSFQNVTLKAQKYLSINHGNLRFSFNFK